LRNQNLSPDSGSSNASNINPQIHLEKKAQKSTHSLFLGSYPKFRDSFGLKVNVDFVFEIINFRYLNVLACHHHTVIDEIIAQV